MLSFYLSALESAADKEDFRALYRRYHGVMERTALAILQDPRDAEEAVQEAFIRVIENFSKIYEIPCKNLGAWLVTIVRNEAITMLRRRRDHLPLDEDWRALNARPGTRRTTHRWWRCLPACRRHTGPPWR